MYESVFDNTKPQEEQKIKCQYCSKDVPISKVYSDDIWINGGRRRMQFCSKDCAVYCQMGAEG